MNMRTLLITTLAFTAFAGMAQAAETSATQAVPYRYGMPLNVGKVIAMTEPSTSDCKVIKADMKYIDSASGKPEEITYKKLSDACSFQN